MRTAVRAELRELGIDALGMDSADDAGRAIASGGLPNLVVLEATTELLGDPRIRNLVQRVPAVLIASRTVRVSLPDTLPSSTAPFASPRLLPACANF